MVSLLLLVWVACGVATAGITYAEFDGEFPDSRGPDRHRELLMMSISFAMFGPFGLLVSFVNSGLARHGWRLWMNK